MPLAPSVSTLSFSRSPINVSVPGSQCTSPFQVLPWGQEKEIFMWAQFLECCVSSDSLYPSVLAIRLCTLHYLEILDLSSSFLTMTFYVSQRFLLSLLFREFSSLYLVIGRLLFWLPSQIRFGSIIHQWRRSVVDFLNSFGSSSLACSLCFSLFLKDF